MPDMLFSATAPEAGIAVVAAIATELVRDLRSRHDFWPTAIAAVGRLTTGAILLGAALKDAERISLQISGNGPLGSLSAEAWRLDESTIGARGQAHHPHVDLPIDARGKFDVAGAIGAGSLQVTKSSDIGQPYVGVVPLRSGEVADDIALYLAGSEQRPSIVALGVLANPSGVIVAGGILAHVLPGAGERTISELEERALTMPPVTTTIAQNPDVGALVRALLGDLGLRAQRLQNVRFACRCTTAKVEVALLGLGLEELRRMSQETGEIEATCEFCRQRYVLEPTEVRALIERASERT